MFLQLNSLLFLLTIHVFVQSNNASAQLPDTDIFLGEISSNSGKITFGKLKNVTQRSGYDNQPSFTPDGKQILFTSIKEENQADIYRYTIGSKKTERICETKESEYSPVIYSSNNFISVVRVEKDSAQRLWKFPLDGCNAEVLYPAIDSVGYYCWAGDKAVAVLRITEPFTLWLVNPDFPPVKIAEKIGRCIKKVPNENAISFVEKIEPWLWVIKKYNLETGKFSFVAQTPYHCEDYDWMNDGTVLIGQQSSILKFNQSTDKDWEKVTDFSGTLQKITRISVSPDGKNIAIAATVEEKP